MNSMIRSFYIAGGLALAACLPTALQAQTTHTKDTTMNRTVVVEQEYNPLIMDASKVNVLPKVAEPTVSKKQVEYATTFFPVTTVPPGLINPYSGKEVQPSTTPGYVRTGYGNRGNLDVLANYLFRFSKNDQLNVRFQMDGMNGKLELPFLADAKWNAFYYRTRANVNYIHQFNKVDLNLGGNFGLSNFNFQPGSFTPKQKFTSGDVHAGVGFNDETAPLRFHIGTHLLMYERQHNASEERQADTGIKETIIRTRGDVTGAIDDQQMVTIALEMNNLLYNGFTKNKNNGEKYFDNYTTLLLNPYYELNNDNWQLHVGANVDLSFGFDKGFRLSPDVTVQYIFADSYVLYAQATGGKLLNDFRRLESYCPYSELTQVPVAGGYVQRPLDTYESFNGALGFKASPYTGIWFNLFGGYQILKNDLSYGIAEVEDGSEATHAHSLHFAQDHTENLYVGGKVSFDYKDRFGFSASYTYRKWDSKNNEILLAVKPSGELSVNLRVHPITPLQMEVGYNYIERETVNNDLKMKAVNDLYAKASYRIFNGISAYVQAHNLLNKKYQYFSGYPAQGFNVLGGLSFRF
ncbi:TonB-dependent receptor [gut metagenome]|uniref:TonB-dependent receptor n=1 Tax=gut metagenome TaxID=749906 RepID=J9GNK0_9ZZZZ